MVPNKDVVFVAAQTGRHAMFFYCFSVFVESLELSQENRVDVCDFACGLGDRDEQEVSFGCDQVN